MKFRKLFPFFILPISVSSCLTRAPTTYELDRRAGMLPPTENAVKEALAQLDTNSSLRKNSYMPARVGPVVQKVWVTDQHLPDGSLLHGTWLFLEIEPGKWFDEVDNSHASFTDLNINSNLK